MKPCVLVLGARVLRTTLKSDELITALPRGAYTTARTFGRVAVFDLAAHLSRLANSATLMQSASRIADPGSPELAITPELIAPPLRSGIASAIRALLAGGTRTSDGSSDIADPTHNIGELKLTCVLFWGAAIPAARAAFADLLCREPGAAEADAGGGATEHDAETSDVLVLVHAASLAARHSPPIRVLALATHRSNAEAKDSGWVLARRGLEATLAARGLEEAILTAPAAPSAGEASGGLAALEGSQTNFFVVRRSDGAVQTADAGILHGTVRGAVLEACARLGVPIVFEPPVLREGLAGAWRAAFLTSTSRLVLPIDELLVPVVLAQGAGGAAGTDETELCISLPSAADATVCLLSRAVLEYVRERSEPVLDVAALSVPT